MIEAIDAAGRPRIRNKVVDIGAYEFDPDTPVLQPSSTAKSPPPG
jgi:hypothetical protein